MKKLIIINGVTGAIGSACLAKFSRKENTVIYGLSRKGLAFQKFCKNKKLPDKTLIFSIGKIENEKDCKKFLNSIDTDLFDRIIYIHCIGLYPFEIDKNGKRKVENDFDKDGINDVVVDLSFHAFFNFVKPLIDTKKNISALIFGGIADKFKPIVHKSWWIVLERVCSEMKKIQKEKGNINFYRLNISSVICPHEILTRPFVFTNTDADARFWLMPHEVANKVYLLTNKFSISKIVKVCELFHKSNYYRSDYFNNEKFTPRKIRELFN